MELAGIGVDREYLEEMGADLRRELTELERQIHEIAGSRSTSTPPISSGNVLFEKLGLPVTKKTSTGKPSTDASVLEKLDHPIIEALLRYRSSRSCAPPMWTDTCR